MYSNLGYRSDLRLVDAKFLASTKHTSWDNWKTRQSDSIYYIKDESEMLSNCKKDCIQKLTANLIEQC